jgi:hypothetical protein
MRRLRRIRTTSSGNVAYILFSALIVGLAVGFPVGYVAQHLYTNLSAEAPTTNLAWLQKK